MVKTPHMVHYLTLIILKDFINLSPKCHKVETVAISSIQMKNQRIHNELMVYHQVLIRFWAVSWLVASILSVTLCYESLSQMLLAGCEDMVRSSAPWFCLHYSLRTCEMFLCKMMARDSFPMFKYSRVWYILWYFLKVPKCASGIKIPKKDCVKLYITYPTVLTHHHQFKNKEWKQWISLITYNKVIVSNIHRFQQWMVVPKPETALKYRNIILFEIFIFY